MKKIHKSLQNKELKMVKIFLFFSDFGCGYLRVWSTRLRSSSYGVAGRLTTGGSTLRFPRPQGVGANQL